MTEINKENIIVLGDRKGQFQANRKSNDSLFATGHEAWAYALNCDYSNILKMTVSQLEKYQIVLANLDYVNFKYMDHNLELLNNRKSGIIWVSLIEGDASRYLKPDPKIFKILMDSDLVVCINKYTQSFFQSLTSSKVVYIGVPYPFEAVKKYRIPLENKQKRTFICGNLLSRCNDYIVAKELGLEYYGYERRIHRNIKTLGKTILKNGTINPNYNIEKAKRIYSDPKLIIERDLLINDFFKTHNDYYIWVNLDDRYTWGRYVLDAAALQIPIITTKSTGHGEELFPETCVENEYDIEKAIKIGKKLILDKDFYQSVINCADEKINNYYFQSMIDKLFQSITSLKENR